MGHVYAASVSLPRTSDGGETRSIENVHKTSQAPTPPLTDRIRLYLSGPHETTAAADPGAASVTDSWLSVDGDSPAGICVGVRIGLVSCFDFCR